MVNENYYVIKCKEQILYNNGQWVMVLNLIQCTLHTYNSNVVYSNVRILKFYRNSQKYTIIKQKPY